MGRPESTWLSAPAEGGPADPLTSLRRSANGPTLADEHSLLVWQTCAYADELADAVGSAPRFTPAVDAMLGFCHYRLLPYLADEERRLTAADLRDSRMWQLLVADHTRLRADVENLESTRARQLLPLAASTLVGRLDRHAHREQGWVVDSAPAADDEEDWAIPLLLGDEIDLGALPAGRQEALALKRLAWMRPGETLRLHAGYDLHPLWCRHHARRPDGYGWVYERQGPTHWLARITRRPDCADG
ncbi:MAG TPA: DUF2249 domain-containing protein [Mycobacteriales bacterium]|nr:DUF2249 domain-containing protein [Mycobacteriales bacterium]